MEIITGDIENNEIDEFYLLDELDELDDIETGGYYDKYESRINDIKKAILFIDDELRGLHVGDRHFGQKRAELEDRRNKLWGELADIKDEQRKSANDIEELDLDLDDDSELIENKIIEMPPAESVKCKSIDISINRIDEIYDLARSELFTEILHQELWEITKGLIDGGNRPAKIFEKRKIKGPVASYARCLQVADLYYVWRWHPGRKSFGQFAGIFEGDVFNLELAEVIAKKQMYLYGKKGKGGKIDADALALHDECEIQECLAVLISDKVRQRQDDKQNSINRLFNRKIQTEAHLKAYKQAKNSRMDIPTHLNVWEAIEQAGGNKSDLKAISNAYEAICGASINTSTLRDKMKQLDGALKWCRV